MEQEPGKRSLDPYDKARTFRISDDLWDEFGLAAGQRGRAKVLNDFVAWYVRRRRAAMPQRPPREDWQTDEPNR